MNRKQFNYDKGVQMHNRVMDIKKIENELETLIVNSNIYKKRIYQLQQLKNTLYRRNKELHIIAPNLDEPPTLQTTPRSDPTKNKNLIRLLGFHVRH